MRHADDGAPRQGVREEHRARGHRIKDGGLLKLRYGGFFGQLRLIPPAYRLVTVTLETLREGFSK